MIRTPRLPNWEQRLSALISSRLNQPFMWGTNDCGMWASDAWLAITGIDHGQDYRGTYSTPRGLIRRLKTVDNVRTAIAAVDRRWGQRQHISSAMTGDIVVGDLTRLGIGEPDGLANSLSTGVCYGKSSLFVGSAGNRIGLIDVPTRLLEHCYV